MQFLKCFHQKSISRKVIKLRTGLFFFRLLMAKENKSKQKYCVYVIGLKPEVLKHKKFRIENPDYQEGKACYYVGSSSLSPEERAEQHRDAAVNKKGNRLYNTFAHTYFDGLRPSKYRNIQPFAIMDDAKAAEKELAEKLRKKGFGVWQK